MISKKTSARRKSKWSETMGANDKPEDTATKGINMGMGYVSPILNANEKRQRPPQNAISDNPKMMRTKYEVILLWFFEK